MKTITFFSLFLFCISATFTQAPEIEWERTFGGQADDEARSLIQTSDGGFAMVGYTHSEGLGRRDVWLVKTDIFGKKEWSKAFGSKRFEDVHTLIQTADGGFAIVGEIKAKGRSNLDIWFIKTDALGKEEWSKTYGGNTTDCGCALIQTVDGGFAIAGNTGSRGAGNRDMWLVKTDKHGKEEWNKIFGSKGFQSALSLVQTTDGGFAMAGVTGSANPDMWLVKTDALGKEEWNKSFGGGDWDQAHDLIQSIDGGFVMSGFTKSKGAGKKDIWLIKTDALGREEWSKTFGGKANDEAHSLIQTTDGSFIVTGYTESRTADGFDMWLAEIDPSGNEKWSKILGGLEEEVAKSLIQAADGSFVIAGFTTKGAGNKDFWLVKFAPQKK